jgi:DNA replication protein DnaC
MRRRACDRTDNADYAVASHDPAPRPEQDIRPGQEAQRGITGCAAENPKLPAAAIRDLARLEFIAAGEGILAYGPVGVGKSHLAAALGHQACRRGHDVAFTTCSTRLAHLAGGHADRSFEARVRKLAKVTLLICDDFAMREFTAAQADDLYELLTERIGRPGRSLILTSNRSPAKAHLFPRTSAR